MLSRFHLILKRNGQTDGRTDRFGISISRVSMLTRDKKRLVIIHIDYFMYVCIRRPIFALPMGFP